MTLKDDYRIIVACYVLCLFVYGIAIVAIEFSSCFASFVIVPLILFASIKVVAIRKPNDDVLNAILGINIWQKFKNSNHYSNITSNGDLENGTFICQTIAHRAAGYDAPENSFAALKNCVNKGCKMIEIDLQTTKDGVAIVFHDLTLDRMIGIPGNVRDFLWTELENLNLLFPPIFNDKEKFLPEKIPKFDDFIRDCVDLKMRVFIDLKESSEKLVNIVLETFNRYPILYETSLVTGFNPFILYKIRRSNPKIVCSFAWRPYIFSRIDYRPFIDNDKRYDQFLKNQWALIMDSVTTWLTFNFVYYVVGISVVLIQKEALSPLLVSYWQRRDVRVIGWTVNSKIEKDYLANILHIPYITDSLEYSHLHSKGNKNKDLLTNSETNPTNFSDV